MPIRTARRSVCTSLKLNRLVDSKHFNRRRLSQCGKLLRRSPDVDLRSSGRVQEMDFPTRARPRSVKRLIRIVFASSSRRSRSKPCDWFFGGELWKRRKIRKTHPKSFHNTLCAAMIQAQQIRYIGVCRNCQKISVVGSQALKRTCKQPTGYPPAQKSGFSSQCPSVR